MKRYVKACSNIRQTTGHLLVLAVGVLLSACSGGEESLPPVLRDDSPPVGEIVSGQLVDHNGRKRLEFEIQEDSTLAGLFEDPFAQDESAVVVDSDSSDAGFKVVAIPAHGELIQRSGGGVFTYTPFENFAGEDGFIYATAAGTDIEVSISVKSVPDAPVLDRDFSLIADQGRLYSAVLAATDGDGDSVVLTAENLPEWLVLNAGTGVLSGVPQQSDIGVINDMVLSATDSTGLVDTYAIPEFRIVDINDPPSLNITQVPRELYGRDSVNFSVFPDDLDNDDVTVTVEPHPAFESTVDGGEIRLLMRDINQAQMIDLTIVGRDERGAVTRELIPVALYPRTASTRGTTISGYKEGAGVHVVILGDGYAQDEQNTFRAHVDNVLEHIRSDNGIAQHLGAMNFHMIETVSQQSGSDDSDSNDIVDTAFDSAYNCQSIPRLVCANMLKMYGVTLGEYPDFDQLILLVNDRRFGGSGNSGGRVAITSAFSPEIALHEMGHSLADLADEYVDPLILETSGQPAFVEGRYKNVSTSSDPTKVPWAHWIDSTIPLPQTASDDGVGVFEGGLYRQTGVYRATYNNKMREYNQPFGPVNTEQWILRLYTLTRGIRSLEPREEFIQVVAGSTLPFSVEPIFGFDVQSIDWLLNGVSLSFAGDATPDASAQISAELGVEPLGARAQYLTGGGATQALASEDLSKLLLTLPTGLHKLTLSVADTSGRIRVSPPHAGIFQWNWSLSVQ